MNRRGVVLGGRDSDDLECEEASAVEPTLAERARLTEALAAAARATPEDWIPASNVLRR